MPDPNDHQATRRTVLRMVGTGTAAAGLSACSPGGESAPDASGGTGVPAAPDAAPGATPTCVLTPEGTEGPYYLDLDLVRPDIAEGRPGVPLRLRTTVVDAEACTPIPDAEVDIWHADATGVYSGMSSEGTEGERFLRGVQITDEEGAVEFETVYPGWYDRRTNHIHVKVHVDGDVVHTGQLYFADDVNAAVAETDPYAGRGAQETTNDSDMFASSIGPESTLDVTGSTEEGYEAAIVLGIQP
ncbi:intradiol ring-cleavage dioxygenase [Nocardiopsis aegyptia]|uniref:intradiol ring-cleavage dioxygenase n=1 Tax=Nocardiopsis aegyptia TaxID=220378 RepID=UPI00366CAB7D